jgi:hypothetical protein
MSRRALLLGVATTLALLLSTTIPAGSQGRLQDPEQYIREALTGAGGGAEPGPRLENFELVGHVDPDVSDYGDLWAHEDVAYLGTRCGTRAHGGFNVQVVDISDPAHPVLADELPNARYTRAEDVVVRSVDTPAFSGDLAVVGIQSCFGTGYENRTRTGLMFYDVTDPYAASLLGAWFIKGPAIGCHEIDAVQRPDRTVLAGCARNLIDHFHGATGVEIVDATDPRNPVKVSNFSLDVDPFQGVGWLPVSFAHSTLFADLGMSMYVSNWDAGTVLVDLTEPAQPNEVAITKLLPRDEDGDNHSATLARGGDWLVINPEDWSPTCCPDLAGWGEVYVFDNSNPEQTRLVGTFTTKNADSRRNDGLYTVHNTEVWAEDADTTQFMSSWYTDGIVWWSMESDGSTTQLGQFVPPRDNGVEPAVWGVYPLPDRGLVLASEFGSGLWILRPTA